MIIHLTQKLTWPMGIKYRRKYVIAGYERGGNEIFGKRQTHRENDWTHEIMEQVTS